MALVINDTDPRRQYTATSGQTAFDFPLPFFLDGDLDVYLTPVGQTADDTADLLTITTDYTVAGADTQDGGVVTLVVGATTGDIITIERIADIARTADYQVAGDLLAETLNDEQDLEMMISQQLRQDIGRSVKRSRSSSSTADLTLPEPVASNVLAWDGTGANIVNIPASTVPASNALNVIYNPAGTGAVATTVQAKLRESVSVKDFGATGNGTTDDTASILAAQTAAGDDTIYVPPGTYLTTLAVTQLTGNFSGPGHIVTLDSAVERPRAKTVVHITVPSTTTTAGNSITSAFDGDLKTNLTTEVLVVGTLTAGDPTLSYVGEGNYTIINEVAGSRKSSYFQSGQNKSPFNTGGRTGWFDDSRQLTHAGKGDAWQALWNIFVSGNDPDVIKVHGVPASGQLAGTTTAGADDVILQNIEMGVVDGGFDVVGKGIAINLKRDNGTAAKDQFWTGVRLQSTGAAKVDAGYQLTGSWKNGIDFTTAGTIDRAIALKEDQSIFFDGTAKYNLGAEQWQATTAVTIGDIRENANNVYTADSTGTTGSTAPTHGSGSVSDGSINWTWIATHSFIGFCNGATGTRIYKGAGSNKLTLAVEGTSRLDLPNSVSSSAVLNCRLSAVGNITTAGVYQVAFTQVLGARITGWGGASGTATRTVFDTTTVTTAELAERVKALIDDLKTHGMLGT